MFIDVSSTNEYSKPTALVIFLEAIATWTRHTFDGIKVFRS